MCSLSIHHIGFITNNLEFSIDFHKKIGLIPIGEQVFDENRQISIQFMKIPKNEILLEVIQPRKKTLLQKKTGEENLYLSLEKLLNNRPGLYHIGYEVNSQNFSPHKYKMKLISKKSPAIALNNKEIEFYIAKDGSIVEIIYPFKNKNDEL